MTGLQLPVFAAKASGLFAEYGLDVELVDAVAYPDTSLQGLSQRVEAVARGDVDFAITAIAYLLSAQSETDGVVPVRFVAALHQRNSIAGIVAEDSQLRTPADLPGRRTAGGSLGWFVDQYRTGLARLGLGSPVMVDTAGGAYGAAALSRAEVEVIPTWMDTLPVVQNGAEIPVRAIPLDLDVYATGLAASDRLPLELTTRMRDALVAGLHLQREHPEVGMQAFVERVPTVPTERVLKSWLVFEPYAFAGGGPGHMDQDRWAATIDYTATAHRLSPPRPEQVYRPELAGPVPAGQPTPG